MKLPSSVVGDSNNEINFPHKLLLTNTQVSKLHKPFANGSSANKILSKTQLSKIVQWGGLKTAIPGTDATIHKKIFGSGMHPLDLAKQTTLLISNEELNDSMKIVWRNSFKNLVYW